MIGLSISQGRQNTEQRGKRSHSELRHSQVTMLTSADWGQVRAGLEALLQNATCTADVQEWDSMSKQLALEVEE